MFSILLDFLMAVFLVRLILWIARLFLTSGESQGGSRGPDGMGAGPVGSDGGARRGRSGRPSSIDRSSAIDVPFTEIPPEGGRAARAEGSEPDPVLDPEHDTDSLGHDADIRSAAGNR